MKTMKQFALIVIAVGALLGTSAPAMAGPLCPTVPLSRTSMAPSRLCGSGRVFINSTNEVRAVGAGDQDIARLQIAMDKAHAVGVIERFEQLAHEGDAARDGEWTAAMDEPAGVKAANIVHREKKRRYQCRRVRPRTMWVIPYSLAKAAIVLTTSLPVNVLRHFLCRLQQSAQLPRSRPRSRGAGVRTQG